MLEKNNNIKNEITLLKPFIYPDYPDLMIFSKQYYNYIIKNMYKEEQNSYSYIYLDFDKLSMINEIYGKDER